MKTLLPGCSNVTPKKWERFEYFIDYHMQMAAMAMKNEAAWAHQRYQYIDLYAGPGIYGGHHHPLHVGRRGSPLIALDAAARRGIEIDAHLVESRFHDDLVASLESEGRDARVFAGRCDQAVDWIFDAIPIASYGLIFVDPNGYPDWVALERITRTYRRIDVMVNLNATVHKRCLKSTRDDEEKRPSQHLKGMNKMHVLLWNPEPGDKHQFCMAYLTNWKYGESKRAGFHRIDSRAGREILEQIDYTKEEIRNLPAPEGCFTFMRP